MALIDIEGSIPIPNFFLNLTLTPSVGYRLKLDPQRECNKQNSFPLEAFPLAESAPLDFPSYDLQTLLGLYPQLKLPFSSTLGCNSNSEHFTFNLNTFS